MSGLPRDTKVDKRTGKRVNKKASIRWNCFNPNSCCDVHDAQMINFSEKGMYFESDYFPKVRPLICIKVKSGWSYEDTESFKWLRSVCVGKVKWWKEIDKGNHSRFGIGVQYYR